MISNFHEKMDNMKVVLQFAQKIDIIKNLAIEKKYIVKKLKELNLDE